MTITNESFDEWLENPVTQEVMRVLKRYSEVARLRWQESAWGAGYLTPEYQTELTLLKAQSKVAEDLSELKFETFEEWRERL